MGGERITAHTRSRGNLGGDAGETGGIEFLHAAPASCDNPGPTTFAIGPVQSYSCFDLYVYDMESGTTSPAVNGNSYNLLMARSCPGVTSLVDTVTLTPDDEPFSETGYSFTENITDSGEDPSTLVSAAPVPSLAVGSSQGSRLVVEGQYT